MKDFDTNSINVGNILIYVLLDIIKKSNNN